MSTGPRSRGGWATSAASAAAAARPGLSSALPSAVSASGCSERDSASAAVRSAKSSSAESASVAEGVKWPESTRASARRALGSSVCSASWRTATRRSSGAFAEPPGSSARTSRSTARGVPTAPSRSRPRNLSESGSEAPSASAAPMPKRVRRESASAFACVTCTHAATTSAENTSDVCRIIFSPVRPPARGSAAHCPMVHWSAAGRPPVVPRCSAAPVRAARAAAWRCRSPQRQAKSERRPSTRRSAAPSRCVSQRSVTRRRTNG